MTLKIGEMASTTSPSKHVAPFAGLPAISGGSAVAGSGGRLSPGPERTPLIASHASLKFGQQPGSNFSVSNAHSALQLSPDASRSTSPHLLFSGAGAPFSLLASSSSSSSSSPPPPPAGGALSFPGAGPGAAVSGSHGGTGHVLSKVGTNRRAQAHHLAPLMAVGRIVHGDDPVQIVQPKQPQPYVPPPPPPPVSQPQLLPLPQAIRLDIDPPPHAEGTTGSRKKGIIKKSTMGAQHSPLQIRQQHLQQQQQQQQQQLAPVAKSPAPIPVASLTTLHQLSTQSPPPGVGKSHHVDPGAATLDPWSDTSVILERMRIRDADVLALSGPPSNGATGNPNRFSSTKLPLGHHQKTQFNNPWRRSKMPLWVDDPAAVGDPNRRDLQRLEKQILIQRQQYRRGPGDMAAVAEVGSGRYYHRQQQQQQPMQRNDAGEGGSSNSTATSTEMKGGWHSNANGSSSSSSSSSGFHNSSGSSGPGSANGCGQPGGSQSGTGPKIDLVMLELTPLRTADGKPFLCSCKHSDFRITQLHLRNATGFPVRFNFWVTRPCPETETVEAQLAETVSAKDAQMLRAGRRPPAFAGAGSPPPQIASQLLQPAPLGNGLPRLGRAADGGNGSASVAGGTESSSFSISMSLSTSFSATAATTLPPGLLTNPRFHRHEVCTVEVMVWPAQVQTFGLHCSDIVAYQCCQAWVRIVGFGPLSASIVKMSVSMPSHVDGLLIRMSDSTRKRGPFLSQVSYCHGGEDELEVESTDYDESGFFIPAVAQCRVPDSMYFGLAGNE